MPNVNDIANLAEALEKKAVIAIGDRCVAVRNRNATCRACIHSCVTGALKVEANELSFDNTRCVNCGACVVACPTEALMLSSSPDATVLAAATSAMGNTDGHAIIACARISSKRIADPEQYAEIPCLARIDETIAIALASYGARRITFVDGSCQTCKYRDCTSGLSLTIGQIESIAACSGGELEVERTSSFPEEIVVEDTTGLYGSTRRGFFSDAVTAARETAVVAARTTIEQDLDLKPEQSAIGTRLRVTADGTLPTIDVPRHELLLNSFDALGEPIGDRLDSRRFATLSIDAARCNSCGMCAVFCPTGALSRDSVEKISDPLNYLEFSTAECVNCRLCEDVCWKGALTLEEGVAIEQLYDFEPVRFDVPKQGARAKFGAF